LSTIVEGPKG